MTSEQAIECYCQRRDPAAFRVLVEQYQRLVYAAARRLLNRPEDIEDVTQQTFLKLARSACAVRGDVAGWLFSTAHHTATDLIRRDATRRRHEADRARQSVVPDPAWQEIESLVDAAMMSLPEAQRNLLAEHFLAGRSQQDIAGALGVNQSTVSRRVAEALEGLRRALAERAPSAARMPLTGLEAFGQADVPAHVTHSTMKLALALPQVAAPALPLAPKLIGAALVLTAVTVASLWIGGRAMQPPVAATQAPQPPQPRSTEEALARLSKLYTLAPGENMRILPPPFPPERGQYIDVEFPSARGSQNVPSAGYILEPNGRISGQYMSYVPLDLNSMLESELRLQWYEVEHQERIPWSPRTADFLARSGLTTDEKMAALARVLTAETGSSVEFRKRVDHRPCIVLKGDVRPGLENSGRFRTVIISTSPLSADDVAGYVHANKPPKGGTHSFQFDSAARHLDAPFVDAEGRSSMNQSSLFYVTRDALLKRTDPDYRSKLQVALTNLTSQIGGTWSIEDRDVEVWDSVVGPRK